MKDATPRASAVEDRLSISSTWNDCADVVLYPGDCLKLLKTMPDNSVGLIVTSPPYNLGKEYETKEDLKVYVAQQRLVLIECKRVLKNTGSICWQVGNYVDNGRIMPLDIALYPIFDELGLILRNRIVWHFEHGLHNSKRFSGRYEVVMWFTKSDDYTFDLDPVRVPQKYPNKKSYRGPNAGELSGNPLGKNPSDVWIIPNVKSNHVEKTEHPCQFPVELVERLVLSLTKPGDWVLDPYIGVGSTAIAALMHGRHAAGSDNTKSYLTTAKARLHQGEKGTLRIRPKERPVHDPKAKQVKAMPPKMVRLLPVATYLRQMSSDSASSAPPSDDSSSPSSTGTSAVLTSNGRATPSLSAKKLAAAAS